RTQLPARALAGARERPRALVPVRTRLALAAVLRAARHLGLQRALAVDPLPARDVLGVLRARPPSGSGPRGGERALRGRAPAPRAERAHVLRAVHDRGAGAPRVLRRAARLPLVARGGPPAREGRARRRGARGGGADEVRPRR